MYIKIRQKKPFRELGGGLFVLPEEKTCSHNFNLHCSDGMGRLRGVCQLLKECTVRNSFFILPFRSQAPQAPVCERPRKHDILTRDKIRVTS